MRDRLHDIVDFREGVVSEARDIAEETARRVLKENLDLLREDPAALMELVAYEVAIALDRVTTRALEQSGKAYAP